MNKRIILTVLCLVLSLFISFSTISAAEDVANNTLSMNNDTPNMMEINSDNEILHENNDENNLSATNNEEILGDEPPGTFSDLYGLIGDAYTSDGQIITLNRNYIYNPAVDTTYVINGETYSYSNGIIFTRAITINGNGYTLNGNNLSSILYIGGGENHIFANGAVLKNINFKDSRNTEVTNKDVAFGALGIRGNVSVENCNFTDNYAYCAAAIGIGYSTNAHITNCNFINNTGYGTGGGAIRFKTSVVSLTISNCLFENNSGASYGGALHSDKGLNNMGLVVDNCDFINNTARSGAGGLFLQSPNGVLKNSRFVNNTAGQGGALYWDGVGGDVSNCNFTHNNATEGGAIFCSNAGSTNITTSRFTNNTANFGGAVYFKNNTVSSIISCSFYNNSATEEGGAVYCTGKFFRVTNSNFTNDHAKYGGGLYLDVGAYVYKCNFNKENVTQDGGGIYLNAKYEGQIPEGYEFGVFSTNFTACHANNNGGAGYVYSDYGVVRDAILTDCTAGNDGGAGYIVGSYGKLINSQLIANVANGNAGALYWAGNNGTIFNTSFKRNRALADGGAIYWSGNNGNMTDSNFTLNVAVGARGEGNGGSVVWVGSNGTIDNCDVDKSSSKNNGGAFYLSGNKTTIRDSTFSYYNATSGDGGAVYVKGNDVNITDTYLGYGEADNGGAIYISGHNTTIKDSNISFNHARLNGGAIYIEGDNAKIINSNLDHSYTIEGDGGCIYINGEKTVIDHSNFTFNNANIREGANTDVYGGSIYIKGDNTNITYSKFQQGSAGHGGAIYILGSNTHVLHSNFTQLGASMGADIDEKAYGGAIYVAGNDTVISYGLFTQTNAGNGGALYVAGDRTEISHGTFTQTRADNGGAIYVEGNDTDVSDSTFNFMFATENGGAIYIGGVNTDISSSTFSYMNATRGGAIFINGNESTIEAGFKYCFAVNTTAVASAGGSIYVSGKDNEIKNSNFTITNAIGGNGGAIYAGGVNTTINHIRTNITQAIRNGPGNKGNGGAIYVNGSDATIKNSKFERYNASDLGGGLFVEGDNVNITNSSFEYGEAKYGGAVYINGDNTYLYKSNLTHNHAIEQGGVIYINGNDAKIINSNLTYSYANHDGGAVYINGSSNLITGSNFKYNNATYGYGGSIYINGAENNITYSDFEFCTSTKGGAIYIMGSDAHVLNSHFSQNGINPEIVSNSDSEGGTIYIAGNNAVVSNDTFQKSNADNGGFIYVKGDDAQITYSNFTMSFVEKDGGAIYVEGKGALIDNDDFKMHNATNGGAIYVAGDDVQITNSNFTINLANSTYEVTHGGSIYVGGNNVDIINCRFNIALSGNGDGGAIYVEGNDCDIKDSTFNTTLAIQGNGGTIFISGNGSMINNITSDIAQAIGSQRGPTEYRGLGGSVYIAGDNVNITDSHFTHYAAKFRGGAVYVEGDDVEIEESTFSYGQSQYGGAVYINGENTHIHDSNFTYNHAEINGGVIYINGTGAHIGDCELNYSYSNQSGGSIYINGHKTHITDTQIRYTNATTAYGGSIYIKGDDTNITGSLFQFSTSTNGGAIYVNGTNTSVMDSTFNQNIVSILTGDGGTVYIEGANALISGSNFTQSRGRDGGFIYVKGANANITHSKFRSSTAYRNGGAIYIGGTDTIITYCDFSQHTANEGAALYINGSNAHVSYSNFTQTNAINGNGGAIFIAGNDTIITECNLTKYNATGNGGALYIEGDRVNITLSYFEYGEAVYGGSVFIIGEDTFISDSDFFHNHAKKDGGVIYINGSNSQINNSNLKFSYSEQSGGAIYIEGQNATVSNSNMTYNNATAHLGGSIYIEGDNTNITGSLFEYCTSTNGGAIFVNGTNVSICSSEFNRNKVSVSSGNGGTVYIAGEHALICSSNFTQSNARDGGFIYVEGNNANITCSHFEMSNAYNYGGAIYIGGENTTVSDSTFQKHNATNNGGAIYIAGENTKVKSSNFTECFAKNGASIYVYGHNALILGCNLTKYNATANGGGVYIDGNNVNVSDSYFEYGEAVLGGAIYIHGENTYLSGSNFTHNHASKDGGIIYIEGSNSNINNSNFKYSYSNQSGGAIYINGADTFVYNSIFTNNNATQKMGGSIYINGERTNITGSSFTNCSSREGGALYIKGDNATVHNSNFTRNMAISQDNNTGGGSIYLYGENALISYSNFTQSKAKDGGMIYIRGSEVNITHSRFERSEAYRYGGAVYVAGINATIDSSTFSKHNATLGGAVYISGENTRVLNSNFTDSHASNSAGGIYLGPHTTVYNSTFSYSTAVHGGAMYNSGGTAIVSYSNFTNNVAVSNGGAIYWEGGKSSDLISHCFFEDNNASGSLALGGAIFWSQGAQASNRAIIEYSTFKHNYASRHGGAIDWYRSDDGLILNCSFIDNIAACDGGALYTGDDTSDGKNLTVFNCTFERNYAGIRGGAISQQFQSSHIVNSTFNSNTAAEGGTIYMNNQKAHDTEYINCTFINSTTHPNLSYTTTNNGGTAYINTPYVSFINCTFTNGSVLSNKNGGAIYFTSNAVHGLVENCSFTNTTNASEGGAIYTYADFTEIRNSTFTLNVARYGGAIYINANNVSLINDTFDNNRVRYTNNDQLGGAVYIGDENNTVINSTFRNNNARLGGAIYIAKSNNNIINSSITSNTAINGAGIYLAKSDNISISNSNITNNNATRGSGIYAENSKYNLTNVRLIENQAHAQAFTNKSIRIDDDGKYYVTAIFRGEDNLLNAIWNDESSEAVNFTDVVYWDAEGLKTTSSVPELSDAEAGINITVTRIKTRALGEVVVTDKDGAFRYYFEDDGDAEFKFTFTHYNDNYYTGITDETSILATNVTINVKDIDFGDNATVNVTLTDRDGNKLSANVTVSINNTYNFTIEVKNGYGSINNVSGLNKGIYNATVTFKGNDTYLGSKNSTLFTVHPSVNITVIKIALNDNVSVGDLVNYTITVTNYGPSNATNVTVWDNLPAGLLYVNSGSNITHKGVKTLEGNVERVTWNIGNLTKGQSVLLWIQVNAIINGTIGNVAVVNSTEGGENSSNITNITVKPVVNLTVVKSSNLSSNALVGDYVTFTITVTNHGPSNATNVVIVDELDAAFQFVKAYGNIEPVNGKLTWDIAKLLSKNTTSVWVIVRVMNDGNFTNMAVVNSTETDKTSTNKTNITVDPQVNLTVVKSSQNKTANVGDMVNFTITVTNNGLSNATDVNVTDLLPAGMAFVKAGGNVTIASITNTTLSNGTTKVIWNIAKIMNGTSVKLWIQVNLTTNGTFTNIAFANSNENTTNSTNTTNITVKPVVDLVINKTVNNTEVLVGDIVEYTITVKNNGPSNATGVYVIDKLDKRLKLINTPDNYDKTTGRWTIGNITKNTTVTLKLIVQVLTNGTIPNFANVTANENDTNITNNNITSDNITSKPKVNLTVIKTLVTSGDIFVGDLVNYTITVTNNGPSNATDVQIVDILIPELKFIKAGGKYTNNGQRINWTIPFIANGTSTTVWIQVKVLSNGTLSNIAAVNCAENETDVPSNITNVTAKPQVNLTVMKTIENSTAHVGDLVNFTIIVTNNGLSDATDVTVIDMLPLGMVYKDAGCNITGCQVYNSILDNNTNEVKWVISKIMNGTSVKLWVLVNLTTNGTFRNVAVVNSTENSTDVSNGTNITVKPTVNLIINKTVDKTEANVGDIIKYTITVTNNGPSNASDIKVLDRLDSKLKFINSTATYGKYNKTSHIWTINNITSGEDVTLTIFAKIISNGTIANIAVVNCAENSTNKNASSENITASPQVNLTIIKKANLTNVTVGDYVNFTITVINNGLSNATNIVIEDDLNPAFKYVSSNGRNDKQKVTWIIEKLENGTNTGVWVQVRVMANGTFTNVASVKCDENSTVVSSNESNITSKPDVNLTVVKTSNVTGKAFVGDYVNFTINVTNHGLSNATMVQIVDELNENFKFIKASENIEPVNSKLTWTIDKLSSGNTISVWVVVRVMNNGTYTNMAVVNSTESNATSQNETNITADPQVNLTVIKKADVSNVTAGDYVNFTITVINNGLSNATNILIEDTLNDAFRYVDSNGRNESRKVTWNINHLESGSSTTVWVKVQVMTNGTFTNAASAKCDENTTLVTSNDTNVTVTPNVNWTVVKYTNITKDHNVSIGDKIKFTIIITNTGLSNATNVLITDNLNPAFRFISATGTYTRQGEQKIIWNIAKLVPGVPHEENVIVEAVSNGFYSNIAVVNSTESENKTSNRTEVTVLPAVNLTAVKTPSVKNASVGYIVNYTIIVTNYGPSKATNVNITDILPEGMEYVNSGGNVTGRNVTLANGTKAVVWNIGELNNGEYAEVWVQVKVMTNGTLSNVVQTNSAENKTGMTNRTDLNVTPNVKLEINKTVDKVNVTIADTVTYTITVKNTGLSRATNVEIKENLKGEVEITGFEPSKGTYANNIWTIPTLGANETATLKLTVKVRKAETVENTVIATSDENRTPVTNTSENVTVNRLATPIDLKTVNITYGEDETIVVTLPEGATGYVNITVGDESFNNRPVINGAVELTIPDLDSKTYNVTVSYGGDSLYEANSTDGSFEVTPATPVIKIEVVDIWYGQVEVLNVTVNAPGYVNITVNNKTITASLDHSVQTWNLLMAFDPLTYDGKATWNIENLPVGRYPVHAVYLGNENYNSVSADDVFNVRALPSEVTVKADDINMGETAVINVTVTPGATGNVTITVDGKSYTVNITDGKAQLNITGLNAGEKNVTVRYNGDDVYIPSENKTTFKVNKIKPPIDVDSQDIYVGEDETVTVTLPGDATGTVTITVDGKKYTAEVINGVAEFSVPGLESGTYNVEVTYSGDDKYLPATGEDTFKVSKVKPDISIDAPDITVGEDGTVTVTLPDDATGTVTIEVEGKSYTAKVKNGKAVFKVPGLSVGVHVIKLWYSGDDKYLPATTDGDINVNPQVEGSVPHHAPKGLEKYPTGNPIIALIIVLMSIIGVNIRKFKK